MARVYITKWVLARGILVADAKPSTINRFAIKDWVQVDLPGTRFCAPLCMGKEAFLTLEEAVADTERRFEINIQRLRNELEHTKRGLQLIKEGKGPKVHMKFQRVSDCKIFD